MLVTYLYLVTMANLFGFHVQMHGNHCTRAPACRLVARLPDASRKAEEYAAIGMFQEAAETAATVSLHSLLSSSDYL